MNLFCNHKNKNNSGFTIIEIVIVIVIIGIIAGIVLVVYPNYKRNAIENALKSDLINAKSGLASSMNFNDHFPTTMDCNSAKPPDGCPKDTEYTTYYYMTPDGYTKPDYYELYATRDGIVYKITQNSEPEKVTKLAVVELDTYMGSSSDNGACALLVNGKIYCWGQWGQTNDPETGLVIPSKLSSKIPVELKGFDRVKTFSASHGNICAIISGYKTYCMGNNRQGQLGNNSLIDSYSKPELVSMIGDAENEIFIYIRVGSSNTCAIAKSGRLFCWGDNEFGELGNGDHGTGKYSKTPVRVLNIINVKQVGKTSIYYTNCAIASSEDLSIKDSVFCWGSFNYNDLYYEPYLINNLTNPKYLFANSVSNCIISENNLSECVSLNYANATYSNESNPIIDYTKVKYISKSARLDCVITTTDESICKINTNTNNINENGVLGDGSNYGDITIKRPVNTNGKIYKVISSQGEFVCALSTDYNVYCWGDNYYGQLGNGNNTDQYSPSEVIFNF